MRRDRKRRPRKDSERNAGNGKEQKDSDRRRSGGKKVLGRREKEGLRENKGRRGLSKHSRQRDC